MAAVAPASTKTNGASNLELCPRRFAIAARARGPYACRGARKAACKTGIELVVVAGDLFPFGNGHQRIAHVKNTEVCVGLLAMVHELAVVAVEHNDVWSFQMRIAVACYVFLHMG